MVNILNLVLLTCFLEQTLCTTTCRDHRMEEVDWFIVYKLPKLPDASKSILKEGLQMMYLDDSTKGSWMELGQITEKIFNPIFYTLDQLYTSRNREKLFVMYNDKSSDGKQSSGKAHAKGTVGFDRATGFWLVHSVPGFPDPKKFVYPNSGTVFGQIFLCATFDMESLDMIASQLEIMGPNVYGTYITSSFKKSSPLMNDFINGKYWTKKSQQEYEIVSTDGIPFVHFAKSKHFGKDLYMDFVMPNLENSLYVQTWLNGNGDYHSECSDDYSVKDVWRIKVKGYEFKESKDHAKWAITNPEDEIGYEDKLNYKNWVCVGDINRQISQEKRGGGTLCFQNEKAWKAMRNSIATYEDCDGRERNLKPLK